MSRGFGKGKAPFAPIVGTPRGGQHAVVPEGTDREAIKMGGRSIEVDLDERVTITVDVHNFGTEDQEIVLDECEVEDRVREIELGEIDLFEPEDCREGGRTRLMAA